MGAGEETGWFSSPPSPRPRTVCCALAGPAAPPRAGLLAPGLSPHRGRQGGGDAREVTPRSPRTALRFCSASSAEPVVHRVPPSKKVGASLGPSPARALPPPRAAGAPPGPRGWRKKKWANAKKKKKKDKEPSGCRLAALGGLPPRSHRAPKRRKRKAAGWEKLLFPPFRKGARE